LSARFGNFNMSRIGIKPITIPENIKVNIEKTKVFVKNDKEELSVAIPPRILVALKDSKICVSRLGESEKARALHGLFRSLLQNAVSGLGEPFKKTLEIRGVGYRAKIERENLVLNVGFTHQVNFLKPKGISLEVQGAKILVFGADKQLVGETAARIRRIRKPDVYKGKGIRYEGEVIKLKPGKAVKGATTGGK